MHELYLYRELVAMWALREIKARYTQSIFGLAWAVFQPIALSLVYVLVFAYIVRVPSDGIPYPLFVFAAQLPWSFFSRGLLGAVPSIVSNMNLVTKIYVPRATFPLASIMAYFMDFAWGLLVLIVMMIYYAVPLNAAMPFVVVLFFIQVLLMGGLALMASALNVFLRDINQMLPLLLQIAMYACPIIYSVSLVPERLRPFYLLNPMAVIIDGYRSVLFKGVLPDLSYVAIAAAISLAVFMAGFFVFRKLEDQFADVI